MNVSIACGGDLLRIPVNSLPRYSLCRGLSAKSLRQQRPNRGSVPLEVYAAKNEKPKVKLIGIGRRNSDEADWQIEIKELKNDFSEGQDSMPRPGRAKPGTGSTQAPTKKKLPYVSSPKENAPVIVEVTKKGRGGKTVTLVRGLQHPPDMLEAMVKKLKGQLGTGGVLRDGCVEVQGDHALKLMSELTKLGYKVKRSGGS